MVEDHEQSVSVDKIKSFCQVNKNNVQRFLLFTLLLL